jgi:hypothetical protein
MSMLRSLGAALCPREVYCPPSGPIRSWFTPEYRKMGWDRHWYEENLDVLQEIIYNEFQANPVPGVNRHVVGAALIDKNEGEPKVAERGFPGTTTKLNARTSFQLKFDVRRTHYREERYNMVYTTNSDLFLRKFLYVDGYEYEDYAAFNNFVNSMYSEYGSPAFQNWLSLRDENEKILLLFGSGLRKMDPLRAIEHEIIVDLFDWALLKGLELARIRPMADSMTVHLDSYELRPHEKINKAMGYLADFVSYGSKTVPHMPQSTNWIGPGQFMLPCAVRDKRFARKWADKNINYINTLEHIEPEEWPATSNLLVSGGETKLPRDDQNKIMYYKFSFQSDAAHGQKVVGDKRRRIQYVRIPSNPLYQVELDPTHKRFLWLMGLLCSGTQMMKMGWKVDPFFNMVYPSNVTRIMPKDVYVDVYGETRIKGEPDAIPAPGAIDTTLPPDSRPAAPRAKPQDLTKAPAYTELEEAGAIPAEIQDSREKEKREIPTPEELNDKYEKESE